MRDILRRERNLDFYISKSVGGSDIDVVVPILFVYMIVNLLILMRTAIKYEIG